MATTIAKIDDLLKKMDEFDLGLANTGNVDNVEKPNWLEASTEKEMYYYEAESAPYRFDLFDSNAQKYFENNGYVAIKNVLNDNDISKYKSYLWDYIEKFTKMRRNDIDSWNDYYFKDICKMIDSGITCDLGIGQSECQWFIRTHPKILEIFATLWKQVLKNSKQHDSYSDTNSENNSDNDENGNDIDITVNSYKDLLCSMDGLCIFRPFEYDKTWKTSNKWYHVDQNPILKPNFSCLQGYVTMYDQNEKTGATTIIPKTHLKFQNIPQYMPEMTQVTMTDYVSIDEKCDYILNDKKLYVCLEKGDLFLWDSRLVHCSSHAIDNDSNESEWKDEYKCDNTCLEFLRLVSFVTYSPKAFVKDSKKRFYENRVNAFQEQMTLTHWPHEFHIAEYPIWEWRHLLKRNDINTLMDENNQVKASLIGFDQFLKMNKK